MTVSTATKKLLTAEEFALLPDPPDGSKQELVKGVILTMPPPGAPHGYCCMNIGSQVNVYSRSKKLGWVLCNDTGFITEKDPDSVRGADVSFWSLTRLPELPKGYIAIPPDLAVEVVSPSDHFSRVLTKIEEYLNAGVRLIWIVDPGDHSVTVYESGKRYVILTENDTLTGSDVLPGFSVPVRELFA